VGVTDVNAIAKSLSVVPEKLIKSDENVTVGLLPLKLPLPFRPLIDAGLSLNVTVRRLVLLPVPSAAAVSLVIVIVPESMT
jgi:hypothetical protein